MSKRGIQSAYSTNCIAAVRVSKWTHSGTVTRNPAIEPSSAIQRAGAGLRSRPTASTTQPATMGTQIASERYGIIAPRSGAPRDIRAARSAAGLPGRRSSSAHPPRQQREEPDDHRERVVVDVARLHVAQQRGRPADDARGDIDEKAVDDRAVADVGEQATEPARTAGEEPVVEPVEVILVVEQRVDRSGDALRLCGEDRLAEVEQPRDGDARDREPERQSEQAVLDERPDAVPL